MKIEDKYKFNEFLETKGNEIIRREHAIYMIEKVGEKIVVPHLLTTKRKRLVAIDEDFNFLKEYFIDKGYDIVLAWIKVSDLDFVEELQKREYILMVKAETHFLLGRVLRW